MNNKNENQQESKINKKIGGRPTKKDEDKRKQVIQIPLNQDEYNKLINRILIKDQPISPQLREIILSGKKIKHPKHTNINDQTYFELNKIGANLNQIVKKMNESNTLEIQKLIHSINEINKKVIEIINKLDD